MITGALEAAENNLIDSECHVAELEESLRDKQALLESAEKRIAETSQRNSDLVAKIEPMDRRIAELEVRVVILPDRQSIQFWPGDASEFDSLGYEIAVENAIRAAGIGVKGE